MALLPWGISRRQTKRGFSQGYEKNLNTMRHQEKSQQEDSYQDDRDVEYAKASGEEKTTKEDSELNDQEATRKEQSRWGKTQEDSEEDRTKGTKDNLRVYLAASQDANEPRESVLHGLQERIRWDQPPEQGDMRVREPG
ncbi:hypothetical protein G6F34_013569 [Rhizopus arrhizus]|nr:hypothetical protein G6F23_014529 [Rhizopus arrhizus]KAG0882572.1 hypothetical protein G6F34_013569 [Rhizopus arrhizus]